MPDPIPETIAAVRGAITVAANEPAAILDATRRLLEALVQANGLRPDRIVSALFTSTHDLDADFPAHAARRLGWNDVPMLCAREIPVPGALPRVVRVMLTVRVAGSTRRLSPVYMEGAAALRPDLAPTRPPRDARRRIAILGLGQIGGSIGLALRHGAWQRIGWDRDPGALGRAAQEDVIDEAAEDLAAACRDAAVAVVAVPVDAIADVVREAARHLPRGAVLLDTGSARATVTPALIDAQALGLQAVGGHPLAGSEGHGLAAARADLFRDATFLLMPVAGSVPPLVESLADALGARPLVTDPSAHDHALARSSHLLYVLSCAVEAACTGAVTAGLYGPGYVGMARLAASDRAMAESYCRANAAEVSAAWRELRTDMEARIAALAGSTTG
jgi:chorismate mutase